MILERWKKKQHHSCGAWTWKKGLITALGILWVWKQTKRVSFQRDEAVAVADVSVTVKTNNIVISASINQGNNRTTEQATTLKSTKSGMKSPLTKQQETSPPLWNMETRKIVLQQWMPDLYGVSSNASSTSTTIRSVRIGNAGNWNGTIEYGGRLVVSIMNDFEITWTGGRGGRLCTLLRDMTLRASLDDELVSSSSPHDDGVSLPTPLLNITIDCESVPRKFARGQGNWVAELYLIRMAAAKARVDYQFQCSTGEKSKRQLIMPWLNGYYPHHPTEWPYGGAAVADNNATPPTEDEVCPSAYFGLHLEQFHLAIQTELRRMAVEMMGPRTPEQDAYAPFSSTQPPRPPLYPDLTLDDVAIHFRCGDIFGQAPIHIYGVLQFGEYVKWIRSTSPKLSIGILTQPFEKERNRALDVDKVEDCRQATYALVDFLKQHYPSADIRIHNGPNETMPLAYARLIMAKQSFTTASTFGILPVIATFGDGYFQKGPIHHFASPIAEYLPNVHEMQGNYLSSKQIGAMGLNATLEWLTADITSF